MDMLASFDPQLARGLHPNNLRRVLFAVLKHTALQVFPCPSIKKHHGSRGLHIAVVSSGLITATEKLCIIELMQRVERMPESGLLKEIQELIQKGYSQTAAQAMGYKEFFDYLQGNGTLADAISRVQQESRRYAKRQLTWFRRDKG